MIIDKMVILDDTTDTVNSSNTSVPSPSSKFLILQRLKNATTQSKSKPNEDQEKIPTTSNTAMRMSNYSESISSTSDSSIETKKMLLRSSLMQEKLFFERCQKIKEENYKKYRQGNKKFNKPLLSSDDNKVDTDPELRGGALHMKEPQIINPQNESKYYQSRGRMEHIDWSDVKSIPPPNTNQKKSNNKTNQKSDKKKNLSDKKNIPEAETEFTNFVNNTITHETTYEVKDNITKIQNVVESSTLKLKRMKKNNKKKVVTVTRENQQNFKQSKSKSCKIDIIDPPTDKLEPVTTEVTKKEEKSEVKINPQISASDSFQDKKCDEPQNSNNPVKKDYLKLLPKKNPVKILASSPIQEKKNSKHETKSESYLDDWSSLPIKGGRKKLLEEYDDNMISFEKPQPKLKSDSSLSSIHSNESIKETFSKNSSKSTPNYSLLFNKLKNVGENKLNTSLDSDDASAGTGSESLSVSKLSTRSINIFNKKFKTASSQYVSKEPKPNSQSEKISIKKEENKSKEIITNNGEFLMRECHTEYYNKTDVKTAVEGINIEERKSETDEQQESLLKPVSTRYFTKLTEINNKIVNLNKEEMVNSTSEKKETHVSSSDSDLLKAKPLSKSEDDKIVQEIVSDNTEHNLNDKGDTEFITFYKYDNAPQSTVTIQEINSDSEDENFTVLTIDNLDKSIKKIPSPDSTTLNDVTPYDDIDPDEEFDIVDIDDLQPYQHLLNSLKSVQKAIASVDAEHSQAIEDIKVNNNENAKNKFSSNLGSSESSIETSDSIYSSINASVSSNLETDNNDTLNVSSSPNSSPNITSDLFQNLEINPSQLNHLEYCDNVPKLDNVINTADKQTVSKRKKKMMNALNKYQKNLKTADTRDKCKEDQQLVDSSKDDSLRTAETLKSHQILDEIKKRNLHLSCKPLTEQILN